MSNSKDLHAAVQLAPWLQERVKNVARLKSELTLQGLEAENFHVHGDKLRDPVRAFIDTLRTVGNHAALVMEDDIQLCEDFLEKAQQVISEHPGVLIQFFTLKPSDVERGSGMRAPSSFLSNCCVYYPEGMAQDVVRYYENSSEWSAGHSQHPTGQDLLVREYLVKTKQPYWIELPTLANHLPVTSAIDPRRSKKRQSPHFKDSE